MIIIFLVIQIFVFACDDRYNRPLARMLEPPQDAVLDTEALRSDAQNPPLSPSHYQG